MRKTQKLLAMLLALVMVFSLGSLAFAAESAPAYTVTGDYSGKTVLIHTNDIHGAVENYAKIAALEAEFVAAGAEVILIDAGDYIQGTTYVSVSQGATAVELMNKTGYDIVTLGNHEFDYGYENLQTILADAEFEVTSNIKYNGSNVYDGSITVETAAGPVVEFIGLTTAETATKAHPAKIKGVTFPAGNAVYTETQKIVDASEADVIIAIAHLGVDASSEPNRSSDVYAKVTGLDFIIDGHSHTVMTEGANGEPIQSTGTKAANVGIIVIGEDGIESNELVDLTGYASVDTDVKAAADAIVAEIEDIYGATFATTEVLLNGEREPGVRTQATNLGDLIADAILWQATKDGGLPVPVENVVAITNGGGIRATIKEGDITMNDINTVLPFGNTVAFVYVTGAELLEALEASTYCTPVSVGAFPQTAGIKYTLDATKEYDQGDIYPGSTYYGPKSINRVTIESINGKAFDEKATYAIVTNDFLAAGGDTYYAFSVAENVIDTGVPMDEAVVAYITEELDGKVTAAAYGKEDDELTIILPEEEETLDDVTIGGLDNNIWMTKYGNVYCDAKAETFAKEYEYGDIVTVKFLDKSLDLPVIPTYAYVDSGKPAIIMEKAATGEPTGYISFAINMGNFADTYGIATKMTGDDGSWSWKAKDGVTFPIEIDFAMKEAGGYKDEYLIRDLNRTNDRDDYKHLTDAEFANFRAIVDGKLYRSSSPINPEIGRNTYSDAAIEKAGVTVVMNLADSEEDAKKYEGFDETYYSEQNVIYLGLGVDFQAADFKAGLAKGLKFFAENKGTYLVHCTEGKDRAGFVSALLESLLGFEYDEIVADYMLTYANYYGVEEGTEKYEAIKNSNIVKSLCTAYGVEDLAKADLVVEAKEYIKSIGLTDAEIDALIANLGGKKVDLVVVPSAQALAVDGEKVSAEAYNINGSNFFKLRDLAALLTGSAAQFDIEFDTAKNEIYITTGVAYTPVGGELEKGADKSATCVVSEWTIYVDGVAVDAEAYNIGGNNYFKLRDIGDALDFCVHYLGYISTILVFTED